MKAWIRKHYTSPDEIRLEQILGGTTITFGRFRDKQTGYPLSFVMTRGRLLRSERFRRAVLDDKGVLANDVRMAIGIRGPEYEHDVLNAMERDEWLAEQGWTLRWIPRSWLYTNPDKVRAIVHQFI
jgi:very-short-patch-repair endonuclease